jgi:hypothetical protein
MLLPSQRVGYGLSVPLTRYSEFTHYVWAHIVAILLRAAQEHRANKPTAEYYCCA